MQTLRWKVAAAALAMCGTAAVSGQTTSGQSVGGDVGAPSAPPECAGLVGSGLSDCMRAYQALTSGTAGGAYGGGSVSGGSVSGGSVSGDSVSGGYGTSTQGGVSGSANTTAIPGSATRLDIDTRDTGVDLGFMRGPDGSVMPKTATSAARGASAHRPALHGAGSPKNGASSNGSADAAALGAANDPGAYAKPGTSALGSPTSAGRFNGNSGTDDGRSPAPANGRSDVVNSGASGNGLGTARSGNTMGPAPTGHTGAGNAASGNTGTSSAGNSTDADTAAHAASTSRSAGTNPAVGGTTGGAGAASGGGAGGGGR
ncbi:MAG TPA: hypothetical protein VGI14_10905 [Casimicrobiaceae bacterium]